MKNFILGCLLVLALSSIAFAQVYNETLTITSYYPSPNGVYRTLRLFPTDEPTGAGAVPGAMYYNATGLGNVKFHNQTQWVNITAPLCHLQPYSGGVTLCPLGYYSGTYGAAVTGHIMCCRTDNVP